uniref:Uncharacterized protein LOC111099734 isoform X2 n=1 Tax=Crassostrea virginica TaxID=6565 RepID=A0A8B8A6T5_CRAVI|nr:uncharacterized protein LOC111099734 isoform X2 [Crassostrea virginica]
MLTIWSEEDMSFSNKQRPLDHEEVHLTSLQQTGNGHHQYTPVITDPIDSPKRAPSRRQQVEKAWDDLCILLQKELQIKEWRFIIRELYVPSPASRSMCGHLASPVLLLQNNQMFRQTQGGVQAPAFTDLSVIKKGDKKKTPDNEVPEDLVENKGEEPKSSKDETEVDQQEEIACNEIEERRDEGIEEKEAVETKSRQDEPVTENTPTDVAQQRRDDKIEKGDVENFQEDKPADDRQEEKKPGRKIAEATGTKRKRRVFLNYQDSEVFLEDYAVVAAMGVMDLKQNQKQIHHYENSAVKTRTSLYCLFCLAGNHWVASSNNQSVIQGV